MNIGAALCLAAVVLMIVSLFEVALDAALLPMRAPRESE